MFFRQPLPLADGLAGEEPGIVFVVGPRLPLAVHQLQDPAFDAGAAEELEELGLGEAVPEAQLFEQAPVAGRMDIDGLAVAYEISGQGPRLVRRSAGSTGGGHGQEEGGEQVEGKKQRVMAQRSWQRHGGMRPAYRWVGR